MEIDYDDLVAQLDIKHRRRSALRGLMLAGTAATPAVRRGLQHDSATVRKACCKVLDHFLDEEALPELMANLDHPEPTVRGWALHALACDRCKEGSCRPGEDDSLPIAIRMFQDDPDQHVRQQAAGLIGPAVHRRADALAAMERAAQQDPHPAVRKIASWWIPGGPRYEKTRPRPAR